MDPRVSPVYPYYEPHRRFFAWVTWTVVASTVGVFGLQLVDLHRYGVDFIGESLAFSSDAVREHRYWTVLTYAWAHAVALFGQSRFFWLHIVFNMIPLICLGPALERVMGHFRFLGLYVGGAIASAVFWFYFNWHSFESIIGASGSIFAIIAGIGVAQPRARVTVLLFGLLPLRMSMGALALVACGIELAQILCGFVPRLQWLAMSEIAHTAHLGGAMFGALYTWVVVPHRYYENPPFDEPGAH
jgi:membrane associated rhomboid family serine protease